MANEDFGLLITPTSEYLDQLYSGYLKSLSRDLPRVVVIDDDPLFGKIIQAQADRLHIPLRYYKSVKDFEQSTDQGFDVAVVDYELQNITGIQLCEAWEKCGRHEPVILVSEYSKVPVEKSPSIVKRFTRKSKGPKTILELAVRAHYRRKNRGF